MNNTIHIISFDTMNAAQAQRGTAVGFTFDSTTHFFSDEDWYFSDNI